VDRCARLDSYRIYFRMPYAKTVRAHCVGPADQWHVEGDRWQQIVEALQECGREDLGVGQQGTLMAVERAEGGKFIQ